LSGHPSFRAPEQEKIAAVLEAFVNQRSDRETQRAQGQNHIVRHLISFGVRAA
jgi:hypothetical protein